MQPPFSFVYAGEISAVESKLARLTSLAVADGFTIRYIHVGGAEYIETEHFVDCLGRSILFDTEYPPVVMRRSFDARFLVSEISVSHVEGASIANE